MAEVKKYIRDGKVAVLISGDYVGGWSTVMYDEEKNNSMIFDPDIVQVILNGNLNNLSDDKIADEVGDIVRKNYEDYYAEHHGQFFDSYIPDSVEWVKEGTLFYIENDDGKEILTTADEFIVA